ncbi:LLM class flavin-dependent oxidoreductase [Aneurinibacillus aneurinilyticus]|uniref:Luciferase family oxidoreductase, FMN-dependent, PP_0088 family n=1 Tax=Aneurinibacillus aneurinilyticus ATCC 12856 TaxID=649747 RepID=U1XB78_ANEAE|nr:LLM class flavin-dependent oxidoreductase [Aneurinibacillus aneurinilyticus]ERI11788.1 luciferase family oxidoreductase, FMN-dependent, PP_0088 family [Aneurinibacillus aneurinilyticus ATCC 12856]MED0706592.1 LLM class flavin-dependent oxidoreductase [Aneurinibacillus aneurinilyticus]MED0725591.1 LLM class flavin-dependent oxidoreductase [Aneurinibacillus aneurinilyticus]MED0734768.1 LLM class flavin-dependent oxidoreductase [Aneurinibacillus aneurinilyticus]MED0739938.1 LLM class flavin-de
MSEENFLKQSKKQFNDIPLSILDLAPIVSGGTPADSFQNTLDLAQHAEKWGFNRYWLAEHHNMPGIASSATSVVIGYVAAGTSKIRVGSGGIMLPNHAPLVIAEQFGTLESLYPGRIDLGLGRAPGTDQMTMRALRRDSRSDGQDFPEQLDELRSYLNPSLSAGMRVRAIPGEGLHIPIWLLGSSGFSAQLAGQLGLPFSFASHFSPDNTLPALEVYRSNFRPSEVLDEPYAMVGVNVIAADTDEEARRLATSMEQQFLNLVRNRPSPLKPPVENMDDLWNPFEKATIQQQLRTSIVGSPKVVTEKLRTFLDSTQADELIINSQIYDHKARLHSYEILSSLK